MEGPRFPGYTLLEIAYDWYEQGVTPIPLHHASKHPAVFWRDWALQRPSWPVIAREFITPFYRGIGVLMGGERGLTVLDFDMPLPWIHWQRRTGIRSYTVRTARGYHVYVYLEHPPTQTLSMAGGVGEVKGTGYVVAAPSVHASGHQYTALPDYPARPIVLPDLYALGIQLELPPARPTVATPEHPPIRSSDSPSLVDAIKERLPLTQFLSRYTQLVPSGDDFFMAVCPFHADHNPSLWVNGRLQICRCFAPHCPASTRYNDVINAYALMTGIQNGHAVIDLAQQLELL